MMPGMKDFVSVKKYDGSREHVQKKLILCNLSELYTNFIAQHPTVKICLSKFSQLRPRNCIPAGARGTHTFCVCVHHENVNLMPDAVDLKEPTCEHFSPIKAYHDAMNRIMCSVPTSECYLNECTACPGTSALKDFITSVLADQCIYRVEFQTWQQTDRSTLRTEITDAEDFADKIFGRLLKLKLHSFTAK